MWADTFLVIEQQHAFSLLLWGASTVLCATIVATTLAAQHRKSTLLVHFATQLAVWGILAIIVGAIEWHGIHLRTVDSATKVEHVMWLRTGLDVGVVGIGATLVAAGRILARHPGVSGAGIAIVVHGLALFAIDVQFVSAVSR